MNIDFSPHNNDRKSSLSLSTHRFLCVALIFAGDTKKEHRHFLQCYEKNTRHRFSKAIFSNKRTKLNFKNSISSGFFVPHSDDSRLPNFAIIGEPFSQTSHRDTEKTSIFKKYIQ